MYCVYPDLADEFISEWKRIYNIYNDDDTNRDIADYAWEVTVGRKVGATTSNGISDRLPKYCWANAYSKIEYYMGSSFENMFKSEAEVGNILIEHGQYISGEHFKVVDIDLWKTVLTKVHSSQGNTGSLVFRGPLKYYRSDSRHSLGYDKLKESMVHLFIQRGWVSVEEIIESFRNGTYFF